MISACSTALGLGRVAYEQVTGWMTGNLETDVGLKFQTAKGCWSTTACRGSFQRKDVAAHDRKPMENAVFGALDAQLGVFLDQDDVRIVVSADHGTSSRTNHLPDPVPLMVTDWHATAEEEVQDAIEFDEEHASDGLFGTLVPSQLFDLLHPSRSRLGQTALQTDPEA